MWDMYSNTEIDTKCRQGTAAWMNEDKTVGKWSKYEGYVWLYTIGLLLLFLMLL